MKKIPRTAKIGRGRRPSPIWLSEEFFDYIAREVIQLCKENYSNCLWRKTDWALDLPKLEKSSENIRWSSEIAGDCHKSSEILGSVQAIFVSTQVIFGNLRRCSGDIRQSSEVFGWSSEAFGNVRVIFGNLRKCSGDLRKVSCDLSWYHLSYFSQIGQFLRFYSVFIENCPN